MSAAIAGVGTFLPEHVRGNDAWPAAFAARDHALGDRTFNDIPPADDPIAAAILARDLAREANDPFLGAKRRHVAADTQSAADAEASAAVAALADAGIRGDEVDVVLSNSIVPDRLMPPTAAAVAHRVGASRALAIGVDTACASALGQLHVARAYLHAGLARIVLLTQSHLLLRSMPLLHPACPGLGDAASALVLAREGRYRLRSVSGVTHGEHARAVTFVRGQDDASDTPWWKAGGDFRLGSRAPELAKALMRDTVSFGALTVREAAAEAGIDVERIAVLASVQPRGFLPGAIAERLGLPRERAVTTYEEVAHVGACGPVFNLGRALRDGQLRPGEFAALYGQGAGFTRAAAVIEIG
jgi:3-oxoacyl-[acyl-carrier-protein] synthase III